MRTVTQMILAIAISMSIPMSGSVRAQSGHPALNDPHRFAWEVFLRINQPANNGGNDAVWETWATDDETFPTFPVAGNPPAWPGGVIRAKQLHESRQLRLADRERSRRFGLEPRITLGGGQEVRRNQAAFDFIVQEDLWHLDGVLAAFQSGRTISFPQEAIEIKAMWKTITPADKPKYHWNVDGGGTLFGLTALHITTKDVPNWFWATFEHVDNANLGTEQGCHDPFGLAQPNSCDSEVSQELQDLVTASGLGSEWLNYRLDGIQVDFVDATGRPTILGNSEIEGPFMHTSSCITCHSKAAILADGTFLDIFKSFSPLEGDVGVPLPEWFYHPDASRRAMQVDFVWGFLAANRITPQPRLLTDGETAAASVESDVSFDTLTSTSELAAKLALDVSGNDDARLVQVFQNTLQAVYSPHDISVAHMPEPTPISAVAPDVTLTPPQDTVLLRNRAAMIRTFVAQPRIVGGIVTSNFPNCVAVGAPGQWCCTGTLIAPNAVLTAGHCHDGGCSARVFVGSDTTLADAASTYQVQQAFIHQGFDPATYTDDLTVLILTTAVPGVTPAELATAAEIDAATDVRAVGFGTTNTAGTVGYGRKRGVDLPIASNLCDVLAESEYGCHAGREFVVGEPFLNRDTCRGDSGGPAYVNVGGVWKLAGATSRATDQAARVCGDGGNYVRVDKYADWIQSVLDAN